MADFAALLDAAAADPRSPAWDEIWQQSCHQGTCAPASAVLLPLLARACAALSLAERAKPLVFAGFVAVDADPASRARYAADIASLRAQAMQSLGSPDLDDLMFVYLLQAVLGFDGDEIWGKQLDRLSDGEAEPSCPACDVEMVVELSADAPITPGLSCGTRFRFGPSVAA
ncbi:MAG: hypothetical protein HOV79_22185 [Hamadaea sp.]|nr:hypothetical protein [Hamadaea sp.]